MSYFLLFKWYVIKDKLEVKLLSIKKTTKIKQNHLFCFL
ncbi:hypothetical protein MPD5_0716 [Melissococcus plutonius DAT561]|uniref:Uncharacterized protein n=1 Tax=Melissococcus plutonius TaxID=33970 RepID=A0A2Z5Y1T4_9ENTE|nr:hypothetical protein MPD5_0716 [Melissococcus plutonius DAT561]BBC60835.1 hypothetical protein DAT561_0716 [Melissococcus plutonius]